MTFAKARTPEDCHFQPGLVILSHRTIAATFPPPSTPHHPVLSKPGSLPLCPNRLNFSWDPSLFYCKLPHLLTFLTSSSQQRPYPYRLLEPPLIRDRPRAIDPKDKTVPWPKPHTWFVGPSILQIFPRRGSPVLLLAPANREAAQLSQKTGHRLPSSGRWKYCPRFHSTSVIRWMEWRVGIY